MWILRSTSGGTGWEFPLGRGYPDLEHSEVCLSSTIRRAALEANRSTTDYRYPSSLLNVKFPYPIRHWNLLWFHWIQSTSLHLFHGSFSRLFNCVQNGHFLSSFPTKILYAILCLRECYMHYPSHFTEQGSWSGNAADLHSEGTRSECRPELWLSGLILCSFLVSVQEDSRRVHYHWITGLYAFWVTGSVAKWGTYKEMKPRPSPDWLTAKFLLALANTVTFSCESHGTHDHILLSDGSGSFQTTHHYLRHPSWAPDPSYIWRKAQIIHIFVTQLFRITCFFGFVSFLSKYIYAPCP
jgi:hypothetical protein